MKAISFDGPTPPTPAEYAEGVNERLGHLTIELERPPTFFMEVFRSGGRSPDSDTGGDSHPQRPAWRQCADFTEDKQGTTVLTHSVSGPYDSLRKAVVALSETNGPLAQLVQFRDAGGAPPLPPSNWDAPFPAHSSAEAPSHSSGQLMWGMSPAGHGHDPLHSNSWPDPNHAAASFEQHQASMYSLVQSASSPVPSLLSSVSSIPSSSPSAESPYREVRSGFDSLRINTAGISSYTGTDLALSSKGPASSQLWQAASAPPVSYSSSAQLNWSSPQGQVALSAPYHTQQYGDFLHPNSASQQPRRLVQFPADYFSGPTPTSSNPYVSASYDTSISPAPAYGEPGLHPALAHESGGGGIMTSEHATGHKGSTSPHAFAVSMDSDTQVAGPGQGLGNAMSFDRHA